MAVDPPVIGSGDRPPGSVSRDSTTTPPSGQRGVRTPGTVQETSERSIRPELAGADAERGGTRAAAYAALTAGLIVAFVALERQAWETTAELHSLIETGSAVLALVIGALALVRYYSAKNATLLIIGAGFLGAALLDGYHVAATSLGLGRSVAASPDLIGQWSWLASRMFVSTLFVWTWFEWRSERRRPQRRRLPELRVFIEVSALVAVTVLFFYVTPLRSADHASTLQRPLELLPGALFAGALVGYLARGRWRRHRFEVWLVASLIVAVAAQWMFAPFSTSAHDALGTAAVGLKTLSYLCILAGLLSSLFGLYRQAERSACVIRHSNEALKAEIDERRAAETAVHKSEEKYRTILESIREGYYEVDLAGNFTTGNLSLSRLLGYPADEMRRMNFRVYTEPSACAAVFESFNRVFRTGKPEDAFSWPLVRRDGELRFAEGSADAIRDASGEITGFRGLIRDITERRDAQRQLEERSRALSRSNEELKQFAHVASHDLQEPLRMVAGYTQLLARRYEGQLDDEADQFIQFAVDGVTRMQRLIQDLTSYTRVDTHGGDLESIDSGEVLDRVLARFESAVESGVARITAGELPLVTADASQLAQLFENLLDNAIRFRGPEPARIHIGAMRRPAEWLFSVKDQGIGVEPQHASRIFQIFHRLHATADLDGTGIGLAVCRRIVDRLGGRIWVESVPEHGATFYFTVPDVPGGFEFDEADSEASVDSAAGDDCRSAPETPLATAVEVSTPTEG